VPEVADYTEYEGAVFTLEAVAGLGATDSLSDDDDQPLHTVAAAPKCPWTYIFLVMFSMLVTSTLSAVAALYWAGLAPWLRVPPLPLVASGAFFTYAVVPVPALAYSAAKTVVTTCSKTKVGFFLGLLSLAFLLMGADGQHTYGAARIDASVFHSEVLLAGVRTNNSTRDATKYEWCSDSGTNRFVTNDDTDFVPGSVVLIDTKVAVGGGNVTSPKTGTVLIRSRDHKHILTCKDVLYIPECSKKLMPACQFIRKGCELTYCNNSEVHLKTPAGSPMMSGLEFRGLYYFHSETLHNAKVSNSNQSKAARETPNGTFFGLQVGEDTSTSTMDFSTRLLEAHWSYGHLHFDKLRKLLGLKKGTGTDPDCAACTMAKSRQAGLADHAHARSTRSCHRMHMDIGFTRNCNFVFQLCVDDYTRVSHLQMLNGKDEALAKWIALKNHLETANYPSKFAFVKTDSEPIYTTPAWDAHTAEENMEHELSNRYRHDQHGVVERAMQTIGTAFRAMMFQGSAPEEDIPDALRMSNVIKINSPTSANNGATPLEKQAGMKLAVNKRLLRGPMFCLVFAHVYEAERAKHAARGMACVYLGYDPDNNAYLVKEWVSGQRYYTADLTFHPRTFPYRAHPNRSLGELGQYDHLAPHVTVIQQQLPAPPRVKSARVRDYSHSGDQRVSDIPDVGEPPDQINFVHSFGPDPDTLAEAIKMYDANDWIAADLTERNSLKHHKVHVAIPRADVPKGKRVFKEKRVLKRKINPPDDAHPTGSVEKHKVRMTVAAFTKMLRQGIDYEEKHAGTVRWNSIKILIAIAVKFDFDIVLIDIKTFFLYGKLPPGKEMYMEIPDGWEDSEEELTGDYVWKLFGTLYGMPQAPHEAQKVLREVMEKGGNFQASTADDCVYVAKDKTSGYCASGTHVDDTTAVGDAKGIAKLIQTLEKKFELTVIKNPTVITGVQIERNREKKWCKLHQAAYTAELLEKHGRTNSHLSRPADTPMDPGTAKALMLLPTDSATPETIKHFQEIVGGLMWLLRTRIDLMFTINLLCRFLKNATQAHVDFALGRPMRYLAGTISFGIVFAPGPGPWELSGTSDADLAGDLLTARSTSGHFTQVGEFGTIHSSSKLERKISNSTGMSETYSHAGLATELVWDRHIFRELGFPMKTASPALTDNTGVISQSTKAINHTGAKHYRINQAMIKQLNRDQEIKTDYVATDENGADFLTKALPFKAFAKHRLRTMGPQTCP
jgi:hypothetical protein